MPGALTVRVWTQPFAHNQFRAPHDTLVPPGSARSLPRFAVLTMASQVLSASLAAPSAATTAANPSGNSTAMIAHLDPGMSRASVLAELLKSCKSHGVARDILIPKGATPTTATEPPPSVFMRALVRNQRAHLVPVELLIHDMKKGLVSHPTDKLSLFPPKRATLGVYNLGERHAPAPESVLRHLASCLDMQHISAHLAVAADGGTAETKAEELDEASFFNANPVATTADDAASDLPPGLRQVATLVSTEQLTAHLEGLDRPALENLVKLDWGHSFSRDLTGLDDSDVVTLLLGIVADARTRYMSLLYAARSSSAASVPTDPASTSDGAHDGGEDVTLHIDESRRQASNAPWLDVTSPALTLASLTPAGISAMRAVLAQDLLLGHVVSCAVDNFKQRHPGHPMTAELVNAIKGSNDDRYLRAVTSYKPGAFDKAYQVVPTGLMSAWALLYCFNASNGGDRTDLLSKISDIRITTTHNIASLDDAAIKISNVRTACIDLGLDELTNKEVATAICKAADASPPAWQATPQAKYLLAARDVLDGNLDKGVAPTDAVYKAVVDAVFKGRTLAVRARSRLPTAPPADVAQVLAATEDGVLSIADDAGGGSPSGCAGGDAGDAPDDSSPSDAVDTLAVVLRTKMIPALEALVDVVASLHSTDGARPGHGIPHAEQPASVNLIDDAGLTTSAAHTVNDEFGYDGIPSLHDLITGARTS